MPTPALTSVLAPMGLLALLGWAIYSQVYFLTDRVFTAPLDDTYIHLRVAEMLLQGTYGINPGEFAAPSSSILWPFLLVPGVAAGHGLAWAMLLNMLAVAAAVSVICNRFAETFEMRNPAGIAGLAAVLLLAVNGPDLVFLGMEHGLHLLLTALALDGLPALLKTRRLNPWWCVAVLLLPLVRYEGMGLALLCCVAAAWSAGVLPALALGLGATLPMAGFSVFLHETVGIWLPTSVLLKVAFNTHTVGWPTYLQQLSEMPGVRGLLGTFALAAAGWARSGPGGRAVALAGMAAIIGHVAVGQFGWLGRYEAYLYAIPPLVAAHLFSPKTLGWKGAALTALTALFLVVNGLWFAFAIPGASANVYQMHYMMRLLATRYLPGAVGTTDIGLVSYRNPHYVLDLMGLGYDPSRVAFLNRDRDYINRIMREKKVSLMIISERFFPYADLSGWSKVGLLRVQGKLYEYPSREYTVMVSRPEERDSARMALLRLGHEHDAAIDLYEDDGRTLVGFVSDCPFDRYRRRSPCTARVPEVGVSAFGAWDNPTFPKIQ